MKLDNDKIFKILLLVIIITVLLLVRNSSYLQGRFDMCTEQKGIYLNNNSCIDYDIYQLKYNQTIKQFMFESNITLNMGEI